MKKTILIFISIIAGIAAIYYSVYFEKLNIKKQQDLVKKFNPKELVDYFWKNELDKTLQGAISLDEFDSLVNTNPTALAKQYGKTVGISNNSSVLVMGNGKVKMDKSGNITVKRNGTIKYVIAVKYIFSNAARNASGYFNIDYFQNTMDYNAVSTELNNRIKKDVVASNAGSLSDGATISFVGAIEFNTESIRKELEIVPLKLTIIKNE